MLYYLLYKIRVHNLKIWIHSITMPEQNVLCVSIKGVAKNMKWVYTFIVNSVLWCLHIM